ncbi:MAG: holo-ACP synthase [Candidatus Omnitrophica bacterium]|nr:holo-ACP synthase [Candidatus Omnitrophota bacterium]
MRIVGTGVDLVEVPRFEKSTRQWGKRFLERIFTAGELAYASKHKSKAQHLAVRFAAKEAVVKALGAPKGLGLEWKDLEITRAPSGQPGVVFHGTLKRWKKFQVHLSLTHTAQYAVASAVVCSR